MAASRRLTVARTNAWRWAAAGLATLALSVAIALTWQRSGAEQASRTLSLLLAMLAALALPLRWAVRSSRPRVASTPDQVASAAAMLALEVRRHWGAEARMRQLLDTESLPIRWRSTGDSSLHDPAGDMAAFARDFLDLPSRRLVLIGGPASGKTSLAVLLTLALCEQRIAADPVPLLLPVAGWNPVSEHLLDWIERRLAEDYPSLRDTATFGATAARDLVADGMLLPVLDGLDELPGARERDALTAINDELAGGGAIVVTCRTDEYRAAVEAANDVIRGAAVLEAAPVRLDDAIDFLHGVTTRTPRGERWQPVFAHLRCVPDGPLASALSSPLMVSLVRAVYAGAGAQPTELIDGCRFPDRDAVEEHLLDAFIPSLVERARRVHAAGDRAQGWEPAQAMRWLTFIARHLRALDTGDLAWWHLRPAAPVSPVQLVGFALVVGLAYGSTRGAAFGAMSGVVNGLLAGLLAVGYTGVVLGLVGTEQPSVAGGSLRWPFPVLLWLAPGIAVGLVATLVFGLALGARPGALAGREFGVVGLLVFGLAGLLLRAPGMRRPPSRWSPTARGAAAALAFTLIYGLSIGLMWGLLQGPVEGLKTGLEGLLSVGLVFGLGVGALVALAPAEDPGRTGLGVRRRRGALLRSLELGLAAGVAMGIGYALLTAVASAARSQNGAEFTVQLARDLGVQATAAPRAHVSTPMVMQLAVGLGLGLVVGLISWLHTPTSTDHAVSPRLTARNDLAFTLAVAVTLTLVLAVAITIVPVVGLLQEPAVGGLQQAAVGGLQQAALVLCYGLLFGLLYTLTRPWPAYVTATAWLALRGDLPWRPLRFLETAHSLGILRQVGAVYQFRHSRLQDHLARASPAAESQLSS